MAENDTAIGAILEIPQGALKNIEKAERAIWALHDASKKAADQVYGDFSKRMPMGVDVFIKKMMEAKAAMNGLGTVNVTLNTQSAISNTERLSEATHRTSTDVSRAVQDMAQSWNGLSKVNLKGFDITDYGNNLTEVLVKLKQMRQGLKNEPVGSSRSQGMADEIRRVEEWIALYKKAAEEKNKALSTIQKGQQDKIDKAYLDEQKRLLDRILQLRKDIANVNISVQRGQITGKDVSNEVVQLEKLRHELVNTGTEYKKLRADKDKLSSDAQTKTEAASQKFYTESIKETLRERNKLNEAITRGNELTAQGQQGKTRLGSGEEAAVQRQLNSDYKAMLKIIKEQGELKAKVASEGRKMTQDEINLVAALGQRYKVYYDDVNRIAGAYRNMSAAAAKNFQSDKSEQLARNAILLADAQTKAAQATEKNNKALHDISPVMQAYNSINAQIERENRLLQQAKEKADQATQSLQSWKSVNPTFNYQDAVRRLDELKAKIDEVKAKAASQGPTKASITLAGLKPLQAEYDAINTKVQAFDRLMSQETVAIGNANDAASKYTPRLAAMRDESDRLSQKIERLVSANEKFNSELSKGNNVKSLTSEYKSLIATIQRLGEQMATFRQAGGNVNSASYQAMSAQLQAAVAREKEIRMMSINEVEQFRQQRAQAAYQADISAFIQAEAQKTAEAKKQAEIQSNDRIAAYQRYLNTYQGAMAAANKLGTRGGAYADTYENRERVIKNLETAIKSLDKADSDYERKLKTLTDALNRLKNAQKEVSDAMKPSKPMVSPQDAINAAKNARSLKDLQAAYKQLKSVMDATNPKDAQWQNMNKVYGETKKKIDDIRRSMGELHNQSRQTGDMMGQLRNQITTVFSVQAITGYIKKMVDVRAQFELQNVALRAILQNKDEADRIFAQVQQMAMQSPFTIMQLNTFTKQLAAYRIESDKLLDTTKMLADVSAGLGVDMGRLILAYGQVKSANYLRATEVRQFTEVGLNIAGELAQYFSELQGKMVSVGDVMEMITKRMVRFEDVEEVFRRVTGAGGIFYDMQKKQAESLYGQIQRIQDALSIMYNEIGKSNQSTIKDALVFIRELIQNWRVLVPLIKNVGYLMAAVFIPKTIVAMVGAVHNLNKALALTLARLKWITNASRAAWITTGIGAFIAIATTLFSVLQGLNEQANALNEELSRIGDEAVNDMQDSIAQFLTLAKTITDVTKSWAEQQDALSELTRGYGEYIDKQKLTSEYLKSLQGDYSSLTAAIREHYAEIEYQNKLDAIINSDSYKEAQKQMREVGGRMFQDGIFDESVSKGAVKQWMDVVAKELATGKLENSTQAIAERMKKIFGDSMGDISKYMSESYGEADFTDVVEKVKPLQEATDNLSLSVLGAANQQDAFNKSMENMPLSTAKRKLESINDSIQKYQSMIASEQLSQMPSENAPIVSQSAIDSSNRRIAEYQQRIEQLKQQQIEFNDIVAAKLAETVYDEINNGALEFSIQVGNNTKTLEINQEKLKAQLTAYFELANKIREVKADGESYDGQLKELDKSLNDCWQSTNEMATAVGVKLSRAQLDAAETTYDFKQIIDDTAKRALPAFMDKAMKAFSNPQLAILRLEKYFANFAKKVNSLFGVDLFDGVANWSDQVDKEYEAMLKKMGKNAEDAANEEADSLEKFNDRTQKDIANKYGISASFFNRYTKSQTESVSQYADGLRRNAKSLEDIYKSYQTAVTEGSKESFLKNNLYTEKEVESFKNKAEALRDYANALYPEAEKEAKGHGRKGSDPWQKRLQLFREINTEYEKLLQNYTEEEAKQRIQMSYAQAIAEIFKGQGKFADVKNWEGFDKESMIKIGQQMLDTLNISPEKRKELNKQLASLKATVNIEIQKEAVDKMKNQMQEVSDNFELSETFRKLGVTTDLVFMLGGKPTTLAEYRKTLEDTYKQTYFVEKKYGDEGVKAYKEQLKKIEQLEQKNAVERAKNYVKYLTESLGERAQIEIKAMREIEAIRSDDALDDFSKQQAAMQRRKKMMEDLAKVNMEELKSSDVYVSVFKDLENASKESLQFVLNKLRELQSTFKDLSPAQVKSLANDMKKLENAIANKNQFKNLGSTLKDVIAFQRERNDLLQQQTVLQGQLFDARQRETDISVQLTNEQIKLNAINDKESNAYKDQLNVVQRLQMQMKLVLGIIKKTAEKLELITDEIESGEEATEKLKNTWENIAKILNSVSSLIGDLSEGLGNMGLLSEGLSDAFDSSQSIISSAIQTGTGAVQAFTDKNPINKATGAMQALGGAVKLVGSLFNIGDKKKERQIKRLQENVERLERTFNNLEQSIDSAFKALDLKSDSEKAIRNLQKQKASYQEMIRLEQSKKDTDNDKIKEWRNNIQDINDQIKELKETITEKWGGFGSQSNMASASNAFAEAWFSAYKETGDGIDALEDKWDEYIDNLIQKQLALRYVGPRMEKFFKTVDQYVSENSERDEELTKQELEKLKVLKDSLLGDLNTELKDVMDALGYTGGGELVLSDLQKGIQNITEPQAAAIEAYLNSMRFAVFEQNTKLDTLITAIQLQYGSGAENPVITELKGIRSVLDNIYSTLRSVVKSNPGRTYVQVG